MESDDRPKYNGHDALPRQLEVLALVDARLAGCTCEVVVEIQSRSFGVRKAIARHDADCAIFPGTFF